MSNGCWVKVKTTEALKATFFADNPFSKSDQNCFYEWKTALNTIMFFICNNCNRSQEVHHDLMSYTAVHAVQEHDVDCELAGN